MNTKCEYHGGAACFLLLLMFFNSLGILFAKVQLILQRERQ